jgi:hypothetical protein
MDGTVSETGFSVVYETVLDCRVQSRHFFCWRPTNRKTRRAPSHTDPRVALSGRVWFLSPASRTR